MKKAYRHYMCSCILSLWLALGMTVCSPARTSAQEKGRGPIVITSDDLKIDSKNKVATYSGNVKVVQGTTTMFSDELVISLDESGKQLKQAVATGNVRLVNDELTATGDEGIFYNQEQKIELKGKAKVWQENNAIHAALIIAYLGEEVLEGYSSGSDERATMTIYSNGELAMPFGKNTDTTEGHAQDDEKVQTSEPGSDSAETDASDTSADKTSPITIEADSLRLDNSVQQGRFSGDVVAVKDATQLYADEMIVYITELPDDGGNDVEKIEIFGHVKIINETQTVTGDKGLFLNQKQYAKIEGENGKKARIEDTAQSLILEAPVVEINLETSEVTAKKERDAEESTGDEGEAARGSERIEMVFGTDETQSMFGEDVPKDEGERFVITERTLETLKDADVPDEILEDLTSMQDREFRGEDTFMKELEKRIGGDNADRYEKLLLKYSKVEESDNTQDLPSVIIQPDTIDSPKD